MAFQQYKTIELSDITKANIGLSNVDNTSDLDKPISTATQNALNNKSNEGHTHDERYYTESEIPSVLLSKIYPVGSIYISITNTSPASFLGGSWSQLSAGYALWTASSGAGDTISAGLPNITGTFCSVSDAIGDTGSFKYTSSSGFANGQWVNQTDRHYSFDASKSSSIYGNSSTVQPPAYKVYAWKRTA